MKYIYTMLFICLASLVVIAGEDSIVLTSEQFHAISLLKNTASQKDSLQLQKIWERDTALSGIPFHEFERIVQLIKPVNVSVYKDSARVFEFCGLLSKELAQKMLEDIASENAEEKIPVTRRLKMEKGPYFQSNLTGYLQHQIFDFYYNNKVMQVLSDPEYVKLLKPKAVFKLLSDTKTAEIINNEIVFIARNSSFKLYNN